jgi:ABC-type lipoprotein release transport system permease subunit
MARGLAPVSAGLLAGGAGSIMAARLFAGLASVPPTPGAWVPAAASALLFFSAAIATWIAARRALAVDPASALRAE